MNILGWRSKTRLPPPAANSTLSPSQVRFHPSHLEAIVGFAFVAPLGTALARLRRRLPKSSISSTTHSAFADPKFKARRADWGGTELTGSPAAFGRLIAEDTEKGGKVIRTANNKPE